jgi:hypothetical protein
VERFGVECVVVNVNMEADEHVDNTRFRHDVETSWMFKWRDRVWGGLWPSQDFCYRRRRSLRPRSE